ncbi:MAG: Glycerol-1-phosphate dehydrogenase (NAD(P)+) [Spirochaetes bacterium ADurb.Bin315]|nr:MAG: Glycerol-1-phosphate dehydrogenase (NAD(P)+) [Spirochaetes bacterium ADurb.Bin315]
MNDTDICLVKQNALLKTPAIFKETWPNMKAILIADKNTYPAAGEAVQALFEKHSIEHKVFIFEDEGVIPADYEYVELVKKQLKHNDYVPVAIGSGTINDLVKRAAFEEERSYMVVATAPSVDGYTAYGAAINVDGFKMTLPCDAPKVIIGDAAILTSAPYPMIASGYADLSAKIPAGADWFIADGLKIEKMVPRIFDMVQKDLRDTLANPKLLIEKDEETILKLFNGLASVGYAMQAYKDSRPASGAEHMVSHIWEMNHLSLNGEPVSHGFKVAIGTLISTAFITELLKLSTEEIKELIEKHKPETWEEREQKIQTAFEDSPALEGALKMSKAKFTKDLTKRHQILIKNWEKIKEKVTKQIIPFEELKAMYIEAKVPTQPKEIAVSKELFIKGVTLAQMIRTRYTSFDLAYELGLFESILRTVQENYFSEFAK